MCGVGDGPKVQATQQPALKRSSASGRPSYQRRLLQEVLLSLIWGITTGCLSYAPKGKLPAGVCLIIIGTEGLMSSDPLPLTSSQGSLPHIMPLYTTDFYVSAMVKIDSEFTSSLGR